MSLPTVNGVVFLAEPPNWTTLPRLTLAWDTEIAATLRGNEGRSALRRSPRPTLSFTVRPANTAAQTAFVAALSAALAAGQCCAPLFGRASWLAVDAAAGSSTLLIESGAWPWAAGDYLVLYPDPWQATAFAVCQISGVDTAGTTLTLTSPLTLASAAATAVYPLLFGRPQIDDIAQITGAISSWPVEIVGTDFTIPAAIPPACSDAYPSPPSYLGRPVFTFPVDWKNGVIRRLVYDLRTERIGFGVELEEPLQQYTADGFEIGVDLPNSCAVNALERFVDAVGGRLQGFWLPAPAWQLEITGTISATQFLVQSSGLASTWTSWPALHLYLRPEDQPTGEAAQVVNVETVDTLTERITLAAPMTTGTPDPSWVAQRLLYVRLTEDELTLEFHGESWAQTSLKCYELPIEYASIELGDRPAFCYHIWRTAGTAARHWYFTSFDQGVYAGSTGALQLYTPAAISHGQSTRTAIGDPEKLELTSWLFDGNPLAAWIPFAPQYDLFIEVSELDLGSSTPNIATPVFSGVIQSVDPKGRTLKVTCATRLDQLGAKLPRFRVQSCCNYALYGPLCRVDRATYSVAPAVLDVSTDGLTLRLQGGGIGSRPANWFQWGDAASPDADAVPEYRLIVAGAVVSGADQQLIKLNAPFRRTPAAGDTVTISAGCNLDFFSTAGCPKFGNQANFGGHPWIASNLSLKAIKLDQGAGGKGEGK